MSRRDLSELLEPDAVVSTAVPAVVQSPVASAVAAGGGVAYDAASKLQRLAAWNPPLRSADADLLPLKDDVDARSLDTLRNDAYVAGGSAIRKDSIVGAQFLLNAKPETKVLFGKEDATWEEEAQEEIETKFTLWAESPQHFVDAARRKTLTDIVRLAVGVHLASGEVLASAEWFDDGRPFASAVQMIDTARLSNPLDRQIRTKRRVRKGVEIDDYGAPVAYYIRNAHPSDFRTGIPNILDSMKWKRVPARKPWGRDMILHIFEEMRPDQTRGVTTMVAALSEMRMTKHFRRTELERAVVAATYAASIESEIPKDVHLALGATDVSDGESATTEWMKSYLAAVDAYSGAAQNLHMDGAKIPIFAPGTHLKIQNPGAASPSGDKFEQSLLRYIAAALGLSYEQLSRDYTQTNYSSARASSGETFKTMMSLKRVVAEKMANFIYRLWLEEAINYNELECFKRRNMPRFYDGMNAEAFSACEWIGAGQGQIDPLKETQAALLRVRSGFSTKETEIAKMTGADWRKVARQVARERKLDGFYGNPSVYDRENNDMENALSGSPRDGGDE